MRPWIAWVALALTAAPARAQHAGRTPPDGRLVVDGRELADPVARFDPFDGVRLEAPGEAWALRLRIPLLEFPPPGVYPLPDEKGRVALDLRRGTEGRWEEMVGELVVERLDAEVVRGRARVRRSSDEAERRFSFDLKPRLVRVRPAVVRGAPAERSHPRAEDRPDREDLVFCAVGGTGTGLPGARRVAESIARLARTGPLDFVLLLGDNFYPRGVGSVRDPLWRSRFEELFDRRRLAVPFYAVLGERDHLGSARAQHRYGTFNPRWTCSEFSYSFHAEVRGTRIDFVAIDTTNLAEPPAYPPMRLTHRLMRNRLHHTKGPWRIAFGHHPFRSHAERRDTARMGKLVEGLGHWLKEYDVDVYVAADGEALEILRPDEGGVTCVLAGGGGGPEMAGSVEWREDTTFAGTGGGFAWFRFDGEQLEISIRSADGDVLFVHRLRK